MRDSQYRSCAAQNQFTAYLLAAIRNYKRTYLKKYTDTMLLEQSLERYTEASELSGETDLFSGLPLAQQLENGRRLIRPHGGRHHKHGITAGQVLF